MFPALSVSVLPEAMATSPVSLNPAESFITTDPNVEAPMFWFEVPLKSIVLVP